MKIATKDQMALIARADNISKDIQAAFEIIRSLKEERKELVAKLGTNNFDLNAAHSDYFNVATCDCLTCHKEFTYASTSHSFCEICPTCYEKTTGEESHMLLVAK